MGERINKALAKVEEKKRKRAIRRAEVGECGSGTCVGVAKWLERATDIRVVGRSNPIGAAWKLWQFPLPRFASVFRRRD